MTSVTVKLTPDQFDAIREIIKRDLAETKQDRETNEETFDAETKLVMYRRQARAEELLRVLA